MGGINFIGSNVDDADDKQSQRYNFDYTDPEKEKAETKANKPKTSFLHRQKKKSILSEQSGNVKSEEAKFVDKNLVRKGKYKSVAHTAATPPTMVQPGSMAQSTQVPTYAPSRHATDAPVSRPVTAVSAPAIQPTPISVAPTPSVPLTTKTATVIPKNVAPKHIATPVPIAQPVTIVPTTQTNVPPQPKTIPTPPPAPQYSAPQRSVPVTSQVVKAGLQQPVAAATVQQPEIKPQTAQNFPTVQVEQRHRIIPTPPPPSIHAAPTAPPPSQPVTPKPTQSTVPAQPIAAIPAGQSRAQTKSAFQAEQPGVVHAQNVEHLHSKQTDPQPISESGKMMAVNLLPLDLLKELNPANKIVGLIKAALVSCTVVGLLYGVMVGYQSYFIIQTKNNQIEINRLEQEIGTYGTLQKEVKAANNELELINTLLAEHSYWSNVFALLEAYTLPNVYYQSFSGNTSGLISLQATTTDFASISQQVHIFNDDNPYVKSASVTSGTRSRVETEDSETTNAENENTAVTGQDIVAFMMNIEFDPTIFSYQSDANY